MAHAGSAQAGSRRAQPRRPGTPVRRARVRWDRLGRVAMLFVLLVLLYLYINPALSLISVVGESGRRQADVAALTRTNAALRAQLATLGTPAALERDARNLGLVRPGEKEFVVFGLPPN
jgi:cell division protein FtsB